MKRHRQPAVVTTIAGLLLAACGGTTRTPVAVPAPPTSPASVPVAPAVPTAPSEPQGLSHQIRLDNGLVVSTVEALPGSEAQLQLGFLVGSPLLAPGLAELAAEALVQGADASQGRPSLAQAVANLGGTVEVEAGTLTTWISIRVPSTRWQQAHVALFLALQAPAQPRSQIERIREQVVAARCASIQAQPAVGMARAMLLAQSGTAAYVTGLLDRDPSEVGLFQARYFRPDHAIFALQVPGDPATTAAELAKASASSLSLWQPPAITAPPAAMQAADFASGFFWSPDGKQAACRASLVLFLPDRRDPAAAELMMLQGCLSLDGLGGRLEQLQREQGLGHVRWTTDYVHSADRTAVVLSAWIVPTEAARLWQTFQLARTSLRDVPPSPSEIELATRRARLTAGLGQWNNLARHRVRALNRMMGDDQGALDQAFSDLARPGTPDFDRAVDGFLQLPAALVVVGGQIPPDTDGVRRFDPLPPGFQLPSAAAASTTPVATGPWLDDATAAVGGAVLLARLIGCESEARLQTEAAPTVMESLSWRTKGGLHRTREVLGNKIETRLEADTWTEQFGDTKQALTAREAALLRREVERHPLALLAAHAAGTLAFRSIAQRSVGDRHFMVLQAEGDRFDRLRVHIDTGSHLIRIVEVWEVLADGTTVHLQDAWSDYRSIAGMRVPFRRLTTQDEGQNRVETVFTRWEPVLRAP